jgi:hypothetical protein
MKDPKESPKYGNEHRCTCEEFQYEEHTCPFSEEIYGDDKTLCRCCPYCEYQCSMDI